jgi:hypothetical protein
LGYFVRRRRTKYPKKAAPFPLTRTHVIFGIVFDDFYQAGGQERVFLAVGLSALGILVYTFLEGAVALLIRPAIFVSECLNA